MRLLHTADWHLGQTLHNHDRAWEHHRFLDWLLDTLVEREIDALLVSGDLFDNANPAAATQRMLYRFIRDARDRLPRLDIVLTAGNHDSPARLEAPRPLLEQGVVLVGMVPRDERGAIDPGRLVVPLHDRDGETAAWCLAIPFLRPGDLPGVGPDQDPYLDGVTALYRMARDHAEALRTPDQALIAMGHCHLAGGQLSEHSERRIVIGGAEMLSDRLFDDGFSYVALGHLHRAQTVAGRRQVRYSGSPLPLSFAEIDYPHQVVVVGLEGGKLVEVEPVAVPRPVDLLRVPARHAPLEEVEAALAALTTAPCEAAARPYLEVRLRLTAPEPSLRSRIESALADQPVRLARIDVVRGGADSAGGAAAAPLSLDALGELDPVKIMSDLHLDRYGEPPAEALLAALGEILLSDGEPAP